MIVAPPLSFTDNLVARALQALLTQWRDCNACLLLECMWACLFKHNIETETCCSVERYKTYEQYPAYFNSLQDIHNWKTFLTIVFCLAPCVDNIIQTYSLTTNSISLNSTILPLYCQAMSVVFRQPQTFDTKLAIRPIRAYLLYCSKTPMNMNCARCLLLLFLYVSCFLESKKCLLGFL